MRKRNHFILGKVLEGDGHVRVTRGERFLVSGGTEGSHRRAADCIHDIDKEIRRDPPQTPGEMRMIVRDAAKKAGLTVRDTEPDGP
ncbi:MAG: hypothetical protein HY716_14380 [Planctomycetes bacterium]|nr:hypothetical protein [Planctomycetota bacterium]